MNPTGLEPGDLGVPHRDGSTGAGQELAQLDDATFAQFMQELQTDLARLRQRSLSWPLPVLVPPSQAD